MDIAHIYCGLQSYFQHCAKSETGYLLHLPTLHEWPIAMTHPVHSIICLIYCPPRENADPLKCTIEEIASLPWPIKSFKFIFISRWFIRKQSFSSCKEFQYCFEISKFKHFVISCCLFVVYLGWKGLITGFTLNRKETFKGLFQIWRALPHDSSYSKAKLHVKVRLWPSLF